jgi:integrase
VKLPRLRQKGRAYYYDAGGRPRKWIALGSDLPAALAQYAELEGRPQGRTVAALWARYSATTLPGHAENTRRNYARAWGVLEPVFGVCELSAIEPHHVATYLDTRSAKMAANAEIALLSSLYEKAMRWGLADRNPCLGIRRNARKARTRYITDDELHRLREAGDETFRVVLDLAYLTGLRQSDLFAIRLTDIRDGVLYVQQRKTDEPWACLITPELAAVIERAKALPRPVRSISLLLCNRRGRPYTQRHWQKVWPRVFAAAGVAGATWHDIRRKTATDDPADARRRLGHRRQSTTDAYIGHKPEPVTPLNVELLRATPRKPA